MSIIDRARPEIRALKPYQSARLEAQGGQILLNANENPWSLNDDDLSLNRYPDPQPEELISVMSSHYGVGEENILVTRGSDEAIDLLVRAFCQAGQDAIIECPPCFGMYRIAAGIQAAKVIQIPLLAEKGFQLDVERLTEAIDDSVKLIFLCSPNNPTGNLLNPEDVISVIEAAAGKALVVVDEAYLEFSAAEGCSVLLDEYNNISILRTLSKAYSLAGARVGALLASGEVIQLIKRIIPPYPLPKPCSDAAQRAFAEQAIATFRDRVGKIVELRDRFAGWLGALNGVEQVWPSDANFLLVKMQRAEEFVRMTESHGVLIRNVGYYPGLTGCVRISIGTDQEMQSLTRLLEQFHGS